MPVEIGIRIKSQNMTGRDFDKIIGDLKKTERQFDATDKEARSFGNTLASHRTQLRNVALDAAAVTTGLGLVGESFVESAIRMEGYRNGLIALEGSAEAADMRLSSLRDVIQLPGESYEGTTQSEVRLETVGRDDFNDVVSEFEGSKRELQRVVVEPLRNFKLELIDLNAELLDAKDAFRNIEGISELGRVTQNYLSALEAVSQVAREELEAQIATQIAELESEHASKLEALAVQRRQLDVDYEDKKITREGLVERQVETVGRDDFNDVVSEFEGSKRELQRVVVEPLRNFKLELVDLNAELLDAKDAFRNIEGISELGRVTQNYLSALEAVSQVAREELEAQIATQIAELESEHASKLEALAVQRRQLDVDYEDKKITREGLVERQVETVGRDDFNDVVSEFEGSKRELQRVVVEPLRNFKLELIDLNAELLDAKDAFRNIEGISELGRVTQNYLSALEAVSQVAREELEAQIATQIAELESEHASKLEALAVQRRQLDVDYEDKKITREGLVERQAELLSDQKRAEAELASKLEEFAVQRRQLEVEYEREKTRITREEVEKRTELSERETQLRLDYAKREADVRLKRHQEVFGEITSTLQGIDDVGLRDRTTGIFGGLLTQGVAPREALQQAQDFIALTDGVEDSIQQFETSIYAFSAIFRREFTQSVQSGVEILDNFRQSLRSQRLSVLAEDVRGLDVISRLEDSQPDRDRRTAEIFAAGAASFREQDRRDTERSAAFVSDLQGQGAFNRDRLIGDAGNLIGTVPLDVVDAVTDIVQVRRDANAELVVLEQESAAEIQIIQESVTLSADNKAKAIERVEREAALKRIQIENEVSQRQRASFQSVVTNFVSGVGRMIAAEAQLALARRATSAISGLFGGAGAGAGLLSGVALPLFGGLALAYGASRLIAPSSPSADVYQSSQVLGSTSQTPGLTRASQETDSPVLEANINVNVEASGTRLGQANERVKLKTERWGG